MKDDYVYKVNKIACDCANRLNLSIEDVEWVKEADTFIMRIIADSSNGLTIDEATSLNEAISEMLDKEDFIEEEYMLEVSSPGLERKLKSDEDIKKAINEYVHVDFLNKFSITNSESVKDIDGYLKDFNDEIIILEINLKGRIKKIEINRKEICGLRKAIKF